MQLKQLMTVIPTDENVIIVDKNDNVIFIGKQYEIPKTIHDNIITRVTSNGFELMMIKIS